MLPTAQRYRELLVCTLLVLVWEEFYFEYKSNNGETSFFFTYLHSWWVHSLALLMDLQEELFGLGVNKGFLFSETVQHSTV